MYEGCVGGGGDLTWRKIWLVKHTHTCSIDDATQQVV